MAALGAQRTGRPVRLTLNRHEDMCFTGKRHPYSSDFKLGLKSDGTIVAYEVHLWQNAGAAADPVRAGIAGSDVRIRSVLNVQQKSVGAFEQNGLTLIHGFMK